MSQHVTTRHNKRQRLKYIGTTSTMHKHVYALVCMCIACLQQKFQLFQVFNFANMEPEERVDPMSKVFPRMTKCNFHKYGGSGTIEVIDALCVLSMNIINEKIYIFLWCWFILVALITGINIVVRLVQFFMPDVRQR